MPLLPTNKQVKRIYTDPNTGQQHYEVFNAQNTYQLQRTPKEDRLGRQYVEEDHNPSAAGQIARGVAPAAFGTGLGALAGISGGVLQGQQGNLGQTVGNGVGAVANAAANVVGNRLQARYANSKLAATGASALSTGTSSMSDAYRQEQGRTGSTAQGMRAGLLAGTQGLLQGAIGAIPGGKTIANALPKMMGGFMSRGLAGGLSGLASGIMSSPTLGTDTANLFRRSNASDYNEGTWGAQNKNIEEENELDNRAEENKARQEAIKNGQDPEAAVNAIRQARIAARIPDATAAQQQEGAAGAPPPAAAGAPPPVAAGAPPPVAAGAPPPVAAGAPPPAAGGAPPPVAAQPQQQPMAENNFIDNFDNIPTDDIEAANENIRNINPELAVDSGTSAREMLEAHATKIGKDVDSNDVKDYMPSDFYFKHPEMKDKYISNISEDDAGPVQEGQNADLLSTEDRNIRRSQDRIPYVQTPFGPLRAYNPSDPKAKHEESYKDILIRMNALLKIGDKAGAKKLYESLPRTDRGIVLRYEHRVKNAASVLDELYNRMVGSRKQDERDEILRQAHQHYSNLPAYIKIAQPAANEQTVQDRLKRIENIHSSITKDEQPSESWLRWGRRKLGNFGNVIAPAVGPNGEDLYNGRYLFPPTI
jgi:hypothetical protein